MEFPRTVTVRQRLCSSPLEDPCKALDEGLDRAELEEIVTGGGRVAIAVGSRKIDGLLPVLYRLVERFKEIGCQPFVVPAMGSHGGATAEGQAGVLERIGITERSSGVPIVSSMDTASLGMTEDGTNVFVDNAAAAADAVVAINRVAPHTGYSGPVQSGLLKMLAVGLGKRDGARSLHRHGFGSGRLIGEMARVVLEKAPVVLGVALVEDGTKKCSRLEVIRAEEIQESEPVLLEAAKSMYPGIPVSSAEILVVDEMGKDISGIGMDPLVTGRGKDVPGEKTRFTARSVVVLRLTEASAGNATGVGHADIITEGLYGAIDHEVMLRNVLTSGALHRARIPIRAGSEKGAVATAIESLGDVPVAEVRLVRIKNTGELEELQVSARLAQELEGIEGVELVGEPAEMIFDRQGNIL